MKRERRVMRRREDQLQKDQVMGRPQAVTKLISRNRYHESSKHLVMVTPSHKKSKLRKSPSP